MILVTGGTGLVGSHLIVQLAANGKKIRALKRSSSDTSIIEKLFQHYKISTDKFELIEWFECNVEDYQTIKQALADVEDVYHCAAMVTFNEKRFSQMLQVNVQGTANIVDACIELGIKKFCHVSSIATLGSATDGGMVTEESVWGKTKGKSGYAISKFRSEMEVWRGIEQGLNAVIVNPSVIVGPGKWDSGSGLIFGTIANGFPFYTNGVTGYVDVRDVVDSMIMAMDKGLWGKRFILNGENLSHKDFFTLIAHEMGKKPPRIEAKPWMNHIAIPLNWIFSKLKSKEPTLTHDTARSGQSKTYYSAALAAQTLGIKFRKVSDAVSNTVRAGSL